MTNYIKLALAIVLLVCVNVSIYTGTSSAQVRRMQPGSSTGQPLPAPIPVILDDIYVQQTLPNGDPNDPASHQIVQVNNTPSANKIAIGTLGISPQVTSKYYQRLYGIIPLTNVPQGTFTNATLVLNAHYISSVTGNTVFMGSRFISHNCSQIPDLVQMASDPIPPPQDAQLLPPATGNSSPTYFTKSIDLTNLVTQAGSNDCLTWEAKIENDYLSYDANADGVPLPYHERVTIIEAIIRFN